MAGRVKVAGQTVGASKTSRHRLKRARFTIDGVTTRRSGRIRKSQAVGESWRRMDMGVVQFRDVERNKYIGVEVDGEVTQYGR